MTARRDGTFPKCVLWGTSPSEMLLAYEGSLILHSGNEANTVPSLVHLMHVLTLESEKLCRKQTFNFYPVFLEFLRVTCQSLSWPTGKPMMLLSGKGFRGRKARLQIVSLPLTLGKLLIFWDLVSSPMK